MTTITEPTVENTVPRLTSLGKHEGAVKVMDAVAPDYYDITYIPGDLYVEANDIKRMNIIQQQHLTERTIGLYQIILKFPQSREKQVDTI